MLRIRFNKGFWASRKGLAILWSALGCLVIGLSVFTYYWISYSKMIDQRLAAGAYQTTARVYAAPTEILVGEAMTPIDLAGYLQRAGYQTTDVAGSPGRFTTKGNVVEIWPSDDSYFAGKNHLRVAFSSHAIESITALDGGGTVSSAEIEPELLTNLFNEAREKRRIERYEDLPKVLVDAVLSAEDKRFFEHSGFDPWRVLGAAWADLRKERIAQGASTITMQVARSFFFSQERTLRRKMAETMVALELEHRFNKKQIFELYANEIYLGNRGSFAIHGFGEGAEAYFGKDVRDLSVGEAAFLAGIIRSPNRYSTAERHPDRAVEPRNRVLTQMVENKFISPEQEAAAKRETLHLTTAGLGTTAAPYFVDMVKEHLLDRFTEADLLSNNYRIYTTLDPSLQRVATIGMDIGLKNADSLLEARYAKIRRAAAQQARSKKGPPPKPEVMPQVQVALVAMDPKTGEIKALIGGRNYGESQLNHALARRQPGSVFKPFVYAAAFDDAVDGGGPIVTTTTQVMDEPTTFEYDGKEYTPNNFGENFRGQVTLREALTHSLNVATVKLAEMIGYSRVVQLSRQLGLDPKIQATPAVALGAYEMTPIEVAAGYTVFANHGLRAEPMFLTSVVGADGDVLESSEPRTRQALDSRVAYIVTNVLQDVVNRGTGATVRGRGFTSIAAGKTGSSRDAWFAGFTSNLLCVVWVGFDDNHDIGITGGVIAAPIWAEFMKRAVTLPAYKDVHGFEPPDGVVTVNIDPDTLQLATPLCPVTRQEVFISGTEPTEYCALHGGRTAVEEAAASGAIPPPAPAGTTGDTGSGSKTVKPPTKANGSQAASNGKTPAPGQTQPQDEKKKGFWNKVFGIFGGKKDQQKPKPPGQ